MVLSHGNISFPITDKNAISNIFFGTENKRVKHLLFQPFGSVLLQEVLYPQFQESVEVLFPGESYKVYPQVKH